MPMIYDPIPFVKLVQKFDWKLRAHYGYCGKILIINLHNLQMLFML